MNMSQAASSKTVKDITIKHVVITCAKPFDEAKKALESSIHELTTAPARAQFDAGDIDGAIKALEALPSLILFNVRPRHVGPMLKALNNNTNVVQYEIGHPLTAMRMTQHQPGMGLYFPIRVFLSEQDGATTFEYDSPASLAAQFNDERVIELAEGFEAHLEQALKSAGGLE